MIGRRITVALVISTLAVSAVGVAVATQSTNPAPEPTSAPAVHATTTVERRDLVHYEELEGTLGFGEATAVASSAAGTVTTTAARGDIIGFGDLLFSVDNEPVVWLEGAIPAYRDLDTSSVDGPDIAQLEAFLVAAGHATAEELTIDTEYTSVTASAVEVWETALGRADPDGAVVLGDVVFGTTAVRVDAIIAAVGTRVSTGSEVLDVTGTDRLVSVDLDTDDIDQLPLGTAVDLELPDGAPTTGVVTSVGVDADTAAAEDDEEEATAPTVPVAISLDDPGATDVATGTVVVRVEQTREEDTLAVDVTALLGLAEGGYALEVVEGTTTHLVAVEIGTFADGYVAVSGDGVGPGLEVVLPA